MPRCATRIPKDLAAFLRRGDRLKYNAPACECGLVTLSLLSKLRAEEIEVRFINCLPEIDDPHEDEDGRYVTTSVSLIDSCEGYDPEHIMCWLPEIGCFGTYDVEHGHLTMFPRKTWSDIVSCPLPYLNAQWQIRKHAFAKRALPTTPGIEWVPRSNVRRVKKGGARRPAWKKVRFRLASPGECRSTAKPGQLFWIMTNWPLGACRDDDRWEITIPNVEDVWALGGEPPVAVERVNATARRATGLEDVPLVYSRVFVVSDRVKEILESAGPGDCQFVAVEVRCRGKPIAERYWAMRALREIDCLDPAKSSRYPTDDRQGKPRYYRVKIDPAHVPDEVSTFVVKYHGMGVIVRDSLRRALKRAKVTGVDFYEP